MSFGAKSTVLVVVWFVCLFGLIALYDVTIVTFVLLSRLTAVLFLAGMLVLFLIRRSSKWGVENISSWGVVWGSFFFVTPLFLILILSLNWFLPGEKVTEEHNIEGWHVLQSKPGCLVLDLEFQAYESVERVRTISIEQINYHPTTFILTKGEGAFGIPVILERKIIP